MNRRGHVSEGIGDRLREARQEAGLSQRDLSFPGCTFVYICRIENGQRTPSLQVIEQLAQSLNVSARWLAKGEGTRRPPVVLEVDRDLVEEAIWEWAGTIATEEELGEALLRATVHLPFQIAGHVLAIARGEEAQP